MNWGNGGNKTVIEPVEMTVASTGSATHLVIARNEAIYSFSGLLHCVRNDGVTQNTVETLRGH